MRIRLSQPPAGDWLAGAWAELGNNTSEVCLFFSHGALAVYNIFRVSSETDEYLVNYGLFRDICFIKQTCMLLSEKW